MTLLHNLHWTCSRCEKVVQFKIVSLRAAKMPYVRYHCGCESSLEEVWIDDFFETAIDIPETWEVEDS